MGDVTRHWPRRTDAPSVVALPGRAPVSTRRDRTARDAATAAALQAYLRDAAPADERRVDVQL